MFKAKFVQSLAMIQFLMFLFAGFIRLCGGSVPAVVIFWPLEALLFVAVVFWGIFGVVVAALKK